MRHEESQHPNMNKTSCTAADLPGASESHEPTTLVPWSHRVFSLVMISFGIVTLIFLHFWMNEPTSDFRLVAMIWQAERRQMSCRARCFA